MYLDLLTNMEMSGIPVGHAYIVPVSVLWFLTAAFFTLRSFKLTSVFHKVPLYFKLRVIVVVLVAIKPQGCGF